MALTSESKFQDCTVVQNLVVPETNFGFSPTVYRRPGDKRLHVVSNLMLGTSCGFFNFGRSGALFWVMFYVYQNKNPECVDHWERGRATSFIEPLLTRKDSLHSEVSCGGLTVGHNRELILSFSLGPRWIFSMVICYHHTPWINCFSSWSIFRWCARLSEFQFFHSIVNNSYENCILIQFYSKWVFWNHSTSQLQSFWKVQPFTTSFC